ncbi:MAG TPA: CDP-alcohol phosphatidyltransferase family protein [Propionibacteriaceae bacterium]|nr:CDP-alcohol phosphatidyltransferase family protein [Propionibacteriaceae bacterium]
MPGAVVGSPAARMVHGFSAGADAVLLGISPVTSGLSEVLVEAGTRSPQRAVGLAGLAELAGGRDDVPLVVAAADLEIALPAVLDLLDRPGVRTAAVVADPYSVEMPQPVDGVDNAALVRVGADGSAIESAGTAWHQVTNPNRVSVGILRVGPADRPRAAAVWRAAAGLNDSADLEPFDLALLALVRAGLWVAPVPLGYFGWRRGSVRQPGTPGSAWQQRLRTASRGGDGFFSSMVLRPLSRRGTALGLRHDWSPNAVTLVSLAVGLATAGLIWSGQRWAWVLAAATLQLALVIDCMDGEIARFTRRFSSLGAWLDGVGDRVKEYAVFAALAAVATRDGHESGWLLAIIAMTVVTARHLEDQSFTDQLAPTRTSVPVQLDLSERVEGNGERTTLAQPSPVAAVKFWVKKVIHVPIAERYLVLSVGLLLLSPVGVLVAAIACSGFALLWTQGGRTVMALLRPAAGRPGAGPRRVADAWHRQLDLGPLCELAARAGRLPFTFGLALTVLIWLGVIATVCAGWVWVSLALAVAAAASLGMSCRPPVTSGWAWQALPLVWCAEAAVFAAVLSRAPVGGWVFMFLAVVAYRRYDLIYSIKLVSAAPGPRTGALGGGPDGRMVALTLVLALSGTLTADPVGWLRLALAAGAGYCAVVYLAESVRQWWPAVRHERGTRT